MSNMEWISVKDFLPDIGKSVLIFDSSNKDSDYFVAYLYNEHDGFKKLKPHLKWKQDCGCWGQEFEREIIEPTHWMYLPEPPTD